MGGAAAFRHGSKLAAHPPYQLLLYLSNFDGFPSQIDEGSTMGKLTVGALRAVLVVVLAAPCSFRH
jgi:hypothetical protein